MAVAKKGRRNSSDETVLHFDYGDVLMKLHI